MNIRCDTIIAISALIVCITVLIFVIIGCYNHFHATTPIEESNISLSEIDQEEEVILFPLEEIPQPQPKFTIYFEPAAAGYEKIVTESKRRMKQEIEYLEEKINYTNHFILLASITNHPEVISLAQEDKEIYQDYINYYNQQIQQIDEIHFTASAEEYPAATEIWKYFKSIGYNDYICAGIIGNLMAEVGGQSLNIQYWIYDTTYNYYGMCQWALEYCPEVEGLRLEEQLHYLASTIENAFKYYGYLYAPEFTFEDFLNLQNEEEAAIAFAKCYERCGSGSYYKRQENATKAYNYFVG